MKHSIIVGLGNPGEEFAGTFHNAGVMALAALAKRYTEATSGDTDMAFKKHSDIFSYAKVGGVVFVRPLVFMNESGVAVREALKTFSAEPSDLVVLHDDSDLPLGEYKHSDGGGSAGHKGIQSIIDHIGTPDFTRVRIGIRNPHEGSRQKAGSFVLKKISKDDEAKLDAVFQTIGDRLFPTETHSQKPGS